MARGVLTDSDTVAYITGHAVGGLGVVDTSAGVHITDPNGARVAVVTGIWSDCGDAETFIAGVLTASGPIIAVFIDNAGAATAETSVANALAVTDLALLSIERLEVMGASERIGIAGSEHAHLGIAKSVARFMCAAAILASRHAAVSNIFAVRGVLTLTAPTHAVIAYSFAAVIHGAGLAIEGRGQLDAPSRAGIADPDGAYRIALAKVIVGLVHT